MFNSFYGLHSNPFDKQQLSESDCFRSNDFEQMTARLNFLKETRGIGVFTARPGMGKSFALRCFAKSLNPSMYHMEYICLSTVSVSEFYKQFCQVLGVSTAAVIFPLAFRSTDVTLPSASMVWTSSSTLSQNHVQRNPK